MKLYLTSLVAILLTACMSPNHTNESFHETFKRNKIDAKIYENHEELTGYLQAKGHQCFSKMEYRTNGNTGFDMSSKVEVQNNSATQSVIEYKLNTKYKNSFGIKTPDANSFIAIASIKAESPSSSNLSAVCRNKTVCNAIKLWALKEHDGCPTEYHVMKK